VFEVAGVIVDVSTFKCCDVKNLFSLRGVHINNFHEPIEKEMCSSSRNISCFCSWKQKMFALDWRQFIAQCDQWSPKKIIDGVFHTDEDIAHKIDGFIYSRSRNFGAVEEKYPVLQISRYGTNNYFKH